MYTIYNNHAYYPNKRTRPSDAIISDYIYILLITVQRQSVVAPIYAVAILDLFKSANRGILVNLLLILLPFYYTFVVTQLSY